MPSRATTSVQLPTSMPARTIRNVTFDTLAVTGCQARAVGVAYRRSSSGTSLKVVRSAGTVAARPAANMVAAMKMTVTALSS